MADNHEGMGNAGDDRETQHADASPPDPLPEALSAALSAAAAAPERDEAWDALEDVAASLQRPDEVAALYRRMLEGATPALADRLGQRAARFHDEWFDDPGPLVALLTRVLDVAPGADWAFHRLTLLFTNAERWSDLLALYDRALAHTRDSDARIQLLDEAAHVAKDFAAQPDRAIAYLEQLFPLKPSDTQLALLLERLFERQARHHDLIKLWTARLPVLAGDEARATHARIAACWLDRLGDAAAALDALDALLADPAGSADACALLERILALTTAPAEVRRRALRLLEERYVAAGRADDVVRILETALDFAAGDERVAVLGEIVERLAAQGRDREAVPHAATLVALAPGDATARARLRKLADRTGSHDRYAAALAGAADSTDDPALAAALRLEAGQVRGDLLGDEAGAIELYARVLAGPGADAAMQLDVARRLDALLEKAGRASEHLDVLERLAELEDETETRRAVWGRAARLADTLRDPDRALSAWARRLELEPTDAEALDATVDLLARLERWEPLIAALRRRAALRADDDCREDLVRVARVQSQQLGAVDAAIRTWREVQDTFGASDETVDALASLLAAAARHDELAALLEEAAAREARPARRAELLRRLGDTWREHLDRPTHAARCYQQALAADPTDAGARAGLRALLAEPACAATAAEALASAFAATDEWQSTLEILEARLQAANDDATRALVLLEAATLHEQRGGDAAAALACVRRALPFAPGDREIERELLRLAEQTGGWSLAAEALHDGIAAAGEDLTRVAELRFLLGTVLEVRLRQLPEALAAYERVRESLPGRLEAAAAVVRVAGRTGQWEAAARAAVACALATGASAPELLASIDAIATETGGWDAAAEAFGAAIADLDEAPASLVRELEARLALWHRDRRNDFAAAEAALLRAVARDPGDAETLRTLAALQRRAPGRPLIDTLERLADATGHDPEALREAAEVALDVLDDHALALPILSRLYAEAARRWQQDAPAGARAPEDHVAWAVDRLVALHLAAGEPRAAVALLEQSAALPFAPDASRALRHRAADLAADTLGDGPRAIAIYRGVLAEAPEDARAIERLAVLYESHDRLEDLLALRRHELAHTASGERRIEIRLEIARVLGSLGDRAGRIAALRENLEERPGEPRSIEQLTALLEGEGAHAALADLLTEQAARLETASEPVPAAALWAQVATLAERLGDVPRALESHRRVVALAPTLDALDALARLHTARGEHAAAVGWLEQRLERTDAIERAAAVVRLAQAHAAAGHPARATEVLETALADEPAAQSVRTLLAQLYRTAGAWEPLARLLTDGCAFATDAAAQLAALREAAEIYHHLLGDPAAAVPILERAVGLAGADCATRTALADALGAAGRLDEARALLEALVEGFGRRRPPERAAVHYQLARIARARGDHAEALAQLELATAIDLNHAAALHALGEVARDLGQLERAERAWRSLLLIVRRQQLGDSPDAVSASEVLYGLYEIACRRGQQDRAREILESGFETAAQSDLEARRFERALRAAGHADLLLRALQHRLARVSDGPTAAEILEEMAGVLAGTLGRPDEALDARLRALSHAPDASAIHDAARTLAKQTGALPRYADTLATLASRAFSEGDAALAGELWLRLGELTEHELGEPARAVEIYARAEEAGAHLPRVWAALDRVYGTLGDAAGQARALRGLVDADDAEISADARTDALYRLAALELAEESTRADGVVTLGRALEAEPQHERAAAMLRRAAEAAPGDAQVVALFEQVARAWGDPPTLLDALERSAALPEATTDLLREAVDVATGQQAHARAEALLERAVEVARSGSVGLSEGMWALLALAAHRRAAGDARGAIRWLREAAAVTDAAEAYAAGLEAAALAAGEVGDLRLAAEIYEGLRERDPAERQAWEPLLDLYRRLGDHARLEALIAATVDSVYESADRNRLRMERARILLERGDAEEEAIEVLRAILDEDAGHSEAGRLLAGLYQRAGREDDLADLLTRQLDAARDRNDGAAVATLSLELGRLLAGTRREDAIATWRNALDWAPQDRRILEALLGLYGPDDDAADRADAMERLLAIETGEAAATLALDLSALRESMGDVEGAVRALDRGFRGCPSRRDLRERLERIYTEREDFAALADLRVFDATTQRDAREAVRLLREAVEIYRDRLGDAAAAADVLRRARALVPADLSLLIELVHCLAEAGQHDAAVEETTAALASEGLAPASRALLLRLRASLHGATGRHADAVTDLEEALVLGGAAYAPDLAAALDQRREEAAHGGDLEAERGVTLRLVEVLGQAGDDTRATEMLAAWVARDPGDRDALRMLADRNAAAERWDAVADACRRLLELEEGEARLAVALRLAEACERAGDAVGAREGLEAAHRASPGYEPVRAKLRALYRALGAWRDLAELVLRDAAEARDDATRFERLREAGELLVHSAGDAASAIAPLEQALKLRPGDHETTLALADAYIAGGYIAEASQLLDTAIAAYKGRRTREVAALQYRMARAANAAGDRNVELAWLNAALDSDLQNGQVASELADLAIEFGQTEIALKALRAVTLMKNPGPMTRGMAFFRQGVIAFQQGDSRKAVFLVKRALSEEPGLGDAQRFLKEIGEA